MSKKNDTNNLQNIQKKFISTDDNNHTEKQIIEVINNRRDKFSLINNGILENYDINHFKLITITKYINNLFRAMSYAIYKSEIYYEIMKYTIATHVKNNWETEKESIQSVHNIHNKEDYYNFMLKSKSSPVIYGTRYEILIFSYVYKKSIIIFQNDINCSIFCQTIIQTNNLNSNIEENIYFLLHSNNFNK